MKTSEEEEKRKNTDDIDENSNSKKKIKSYKKYIKNYSELNIKNENQKIAIITPDKDIIPDAQTLNPAYIVFENYEIIIGSAVD